MNHRFTLSTILHVLAWTLALSLIWIKPDTTAAQTTYTVDFRAEGIEQLPLPAREAIFAAANRWMGTPPENDTFYLIGLRLGSDWAVATLTYADLSEIDTPASNSEPIEDTHISPQNVIALLLVETSSGWLAALDTEPAVQSLLDLVPDSELSAEAKDAIFPAALDVLRPSVLEGAQQQYGNYKLPWQAGKPWARTQSGLGWHGGTWTGRFPENNSLDFDIINEANADILAAAPGIITHICQVGGEQQAGIIVKTSGTDELIGYLHLQSASMPNNIYIGAPLQEGNFLGRMVEGTVSETCGYSIGTHVHLFLPTRPFTMDGYTFSDTNTQGGVSLYSTLPGNNPFPPAPTNEVISHNGTFSSGFNRWTTRLDSAQTILTDNGNPYVAWKGVSGTAGVIAQNLNFSAPAGSVLEMDLELGNATTTSKRLRVHLHRYDAVAIWDDMLVCNFDIPANTPLQTYVLRRQITTNWEDMRIWIEAWPADNLNYVLTDNVRVRRYTSLSVPGTQCLEPVTVTLWDFRGSAHPQGWTVGASLAEPTPAADGMHYTITAADASLYSPTLTQASANAYRYLRVEMASNADDCGRLYFTNPGQRTFTDTQSVAFDVIPDGQLHTYALDMAQNPAWLDQITRLRLDPVCDIGAGGTFTLAALRFSAVPPEFALAAPSGMVNTGLGNPIYLWNHVDGTNYYALYLAPADRIGDATFFGTLPAASYCVGGACAVDLTTINPGAWLPNGEYAVYMSLSTTPQFAEWVGPFIFTMNARQPEIPTITGVTGTDTTSRPTFEWMLEGRAADASFFHLVVVSEDNPTQLVLDHWVSRRDACGSLEGTTCATPSPADMLNSSVYQLYMQSWGPGGFSSGGILGWAGALEFTLNVPPAGLPTNLNTSGVLTRQPTLLWSKVDYATWYQVWVGTLNPLETAHTDWYLGTDIGCQTSSGCSILLPEPLPGGAYTWYVRAWGAGGFHADALEGWQEGPGFVISP